MTAHLRVGLVVTSMQCGGAERMLATLANHLAERGHGVTLHVLHEPEVFFDLHPAVEVRTFASVPGAMRRRWSRPWRRVQWLRQELERSGPDVVVSFIDVANVLTLLAARRAGFPVVVAERTNPRRHAVGLPYRILRRLAYPRAAKVVVQTEATASWAEAFVPTGRVEVIPNPVPPAATGGVPELELPDRQWLVSMGRLDPVKRYDLLIDVFAALAQRHATWSLLLLGEGPERGRIEAVVRAHRLGDRVRMPGAVHEVGPVLGQCRLYALTSRYEGFPNALCEAMACGLPAVSFDIPTGPREIIRHEVDGLLVPDGDTRALEGALDLVMGDEALRVRLSGRATEVVTRFSAEVILARWEALCVEVAERGGRRA